MRVVFLYFSKSVDTWYSRYACHHLPIDSDEPSSSPVINPCKDELLSSYIQIEKESRLSMAILIQALRDLNVMDAVVDKKDASGTVYVAAPEPLIDWGGNKVKQTVHDEVVDWFTYTGECIHAAGYTFNYCCDAINRRLVLLGHSNLIDPIQLRRKCLSDPKSINIFGLMKEGDRPFFSDRTTSIMNNQSINYAVAMVS